MNNEEHAWYESGLSADGVALGDYEKGCIKRYGEILLEQQLEKFREGFEGCCYCCEPVGMLNQELEKENEKLKAMIDMQTKLVVDLEMRLIKMEKQNENTL